MIDDPTIDSAEDDWKRFVVLFHQFPSQHERKDHWDLMLEWNGELITWALSEKPALGNLIVAKSLPNHRLLYLDYQGQVSGDRGSVTRVMEGRYFWVPDSDIGSSAVLEFGALRWVVDFKEINNVQVAIFAVA